MKSLLTTFAATLALAAPGAPAQRADTAPPPFQGGVAEISAKLRDRMTPDAWRPGCPVPLERLRRVRFTHFDFRGEVVVGRLIVHRSAANEILGVMRKLYSNRFPLRSVLPIERFDGSDHRSMDADNTSAFNCRFVNGTNRWSEHAYGLAIDINPRENPYVSGSFVSPPAGRPYADRTPHRKGMVGPRNVVGRAFRRIGWEWGGRWRPARDYQHFSKRGR